MITDGQEFALGQYDAAVRERIAQFERDDAGNRLWRKDAPLWTSDAKAQESIRSFLGWLDVVDKMKAGASDLADFVAEVKRAGFKHVVHMGMGGSSLAPLVLERSLQKSDTGLPLTVLDTTDPGTVLQIARSVPLAQTLFIVASKSGTTAEPSAFCEYFYAAVREIKGDRAGENFVAITDPGSELLKLAEQRRFRRIFPGIASIGGRYSALSYFGLVPAALMGLDVAEVLSRADSMVQACSAHVAVKDNPGLTLGAAMGELAKRGRDKVTFVAPESIATLGLWLEQLIAESTGKHGVGIIPVAEETLGAPKVYSGDRLFVYLCLQNEPTPELARDIDALRQAGHPVVTITLRDRLDIVREFYRWEFATAAAGIVLGINPFDQPNVQESKDITNKLLETVRREGSLAEVKPALIEKGMRFYGEGVGADAAKTIAAFCKQVKPHDYVALLAYLTETPELNELFQQTREILRQHLHVATTLGYGPRFLHSTGQLHKGGPNTGVFLQLTADHREDAPIPGQPYTFGTFIHAQAEGDLLTLKKHGRRALRIDLGRDVNAGLREINRLLSAV